MVDDQFDDCMCGHTRQEHDPDHGDCVECPCRAFLLVEYLDVRVTDYAPDSDYE